MTSWTTINVVIAGMVGLGCSRHAPASKTTATAQPVAAVTAPAAEAQDDATQERVEEPAIPNTVHGANKKLVHPVSVLVDGEQIGVMRTGELPAGMTLRDNVREGQPEKIYFSLAEYLEKSGVSLAKVKTIHMVGARDHIASIEGSELRAEKNRFVFDFGHVMSGMPMTHWATTGLKNQFRIDTMRHITVFVKQDAPAIDAVRHCYLAADGQCAPAYDAKEVVAKGKGTRVYIDGRLVAHVKRRLIDPTAVEGAPETNQAHSLGKYLSSLGADLKSVKGIDFVGGDDVYGRATPQILKSTPDFDFVLPRHSHGRIQVTLPSSIQAEGATADRKVPITSIHIYKNNAAPSGRPVAEVTDEVTSALSQLGNKQTDGDSHESENDDEI